MTQSIENNRQITATFIFLHLSQRKTSEQLEIHENTYFACVSEELEIKTSLIYFCVSPSPSCHFSISVISSTSCAISNSSNKNDCLTIEKNNTWHTVNKEVKIHKKTQLRYSRIFFFHTQWEKNAPKCRHSLMMKEHGEMERSKQEQKKSFS